MTGKVLQLASKLARQSEDLKAEALSRFEELTTAQRQTVLDAMLRRVLRQKGRRP